VETASGRGPEHIYTPFLHDGVETLAAQSAGARPPANTTNNRNNNNNNNIPTLAVVSEAGNDPGRFRGHNEVSGQGAIPLGPLPSTLTSSDALDIRSRRKLLMMHHGQGERL
jgi:hypothetical protein